MRKKLTFIIILFLATYSSWSQNTIQPTQMIGITPVVCKELNLPVDALNSLNQKLLQIVTKNGFGSVSGDFVLTANPVITNKQMTPTAPQQFIVDIDLSIYIINVAEEIIIAEITLPLKGINRLENKATISAINNLKSNNPTIRNFMNQSRSKIINYYSTQASTALAEAEAISERGDDKSIPSNTNNENSANTIDDATKKQIASLILGKK